MSGDRRLWVHVHIFAAGEQTCPARRRSSFRYFNDAVPGRNERDGARPIGVVRTAALALKRPPAVATLRRCNRRNRVARARQRAWLLRRQGSHEIEIAPSRRRRPS